jgi:hypothetical protein
MLTLEFDIVTPMLLKRYRDYLRDYSNLNDRNRVEFQKAVKAKLNTIRGASAGRGQPPSVNSFSVSETLLRNSFSKNFSSLNKLESVEELLNKSRRQIKKIIVSQSSLEQQFYSESNSTDITVIADGQVNYYSLIFNKDSFLSRDFGITWDPSTETFNTKITPSKEQEIVRAINEVPFEYSAKTIREFEQGLSSLKRRGFANFGTLSIDVNYLSDKGIPTSTANIIKDDKGFIAGRFISAIDLTILIRRQIQARMRPRSSTTKARPTKMTSRSFTFRDSFDITMLDYRRGVMNYFYLPYYDENEEYNYEVSQLVESSIRYILQQRLRRQLALTREL